MGFQNIVRLIRDAGSQGQTISMDAAQAGSLSVSAADGLRVNSVIVPQAVEITIPITPHASLTKQNLFTATRAYRVTAIRYVPDLVQGSALTGTVCKTVSTSAPAKTTTPMHAADAMNFNATENTVQSMTLTSTTADLQLAAGDRIGLDLSAALSTGRGTITITMIPV